MSNIQTQFLPESVRNRKDFDIRAGDTVRVNLKIQEKGKTRIQTFEGLVLARKHGSENGGTITVRKVSNGVGVERIFPLYSPSIDSIEVIRRAKVRQSKLYFLRNAVAKTIRYKLRRISDSFSTTADLPEWVSDETETVEDIQNSVEAENEVVEEVKETDEVDSESPEEVTHQESPESETMEETVETPNEQEKDAE